MKISRSLNIIFTLSLLLYEARAKGGGKSASSISEPTEEPSSFKSAGSTTAGSNYYTNNGYCYNDKYELIACPPGFKKWIPMIVALSVVAILVLVGSLWYWFARRYRKGRGERDWTKHLASVESPIGQSNKYQKLSDHGDPQSHVQEILDQTLRK